MDTPHRTLKFELPFMKTRSLTFILTILLLGIGLNSQHSDPIDPRLKYKPKVPFNEMTREDYEQYLREHPYNTKTPLSREDIRKMDKKDRPDLAAEQNFLATMDPSLGYPPVERLQVCWQEIKNQDADDFYLNLPGAPTSPWVERGPNNVGGRTRAMMFDPNDPNFNKVWAAGVAGGIWFNNDITSPTESWTKIDDFQSNLAVTTIAYDPNSTNTFYAGTGEGFFNADAVRGAGIWKSTDGGTTWNQLPSTNIPGFEFVFKIVVTNSGTILAATRSTTNFLSSGLYRSTDGGNTWTRVATGRYSDIEITSTNDIYASEHFWSSNGLLAKSTNDGLTWANVTPLPGGGRIEIASAPSDGNTIYSIANGNSSLSDPIQWFQKSTNGGASWSSLTIPPYVEQNCVNSLVNDFTRGQAWYDLILAVHPTNPDIVIVGGIDLYKSTDGGSTWNLISYWTGNCDTYVHADQHEILFKPNNINAAIIGNDGGVFYSTDIGNASDPSFSARNNNYNVTQFYSAALHPTSGTDYFLGGTQDNGTQQFNNAGINSTVEVTGGDGGFCHISQTNPLIQFSAATRTNLNRSTDGGNTWVRFRPGSNNGLFINPSDYDNNLDILYASRTGQSIFRWINASTTGFADNSFSVNLGNPASHLHISPYTTTSTTLFVGTTGGRVFKIENANATPTSTDITGSFGNGSISCIEIGANEDELLVTLSNYGVTSVWYTNDGGANWSSKEGNLPDFPVRWALFNPLNRNEVILATEMGIWATTDLSVASPSWAASNLGLANVRVDMLQTRPSDNKVLAATHGRGMYTSTFSAIFPCEITDISIDNISACDDKGTADPSDDTFTADVTVTFANAPATGTLDLAGDGTASIAVGSLGSMTSHEFTGVSMTADGGSIDLMAAFSDELACSYTENNVGTAPDACSMQPCEISDIVLSNISACDDNGTADPSDDTFTADVLVSFANAPATGSLDLSGDGTETVAVGGLNSATSHTFVGVTMSADGMAISLTAAFSDDAACTFTEDNAGTAPDACSVPDCIIDAISLSNISACDDNGTADPSDDTFTADVLVSFANAPATGSLDLSGDGTETVAVGALNSATSHTFVGVTMSADGIAISLTAAFSDDAACTFTEANAGTAPDACSVPDCIIDAISLSNISACDDNGTADPSDDTFTADVLVSFANAPATGSLDLSGDGTETVAVGALNSATSHTFVGVTMSADGIAISLTAAFSDDAACTFTEANAGTAPDACSVPDCIIDAISLSNISACDDNGTADPSDDTFTADVLVSFANAPATGSLDLSGDGTETVAVGALNSATSHTFVGVTMSADGIAISLTAAFSDDAACTFTEDNAGTAPDACSVPDCIIDAISLSNISACDDNGTADPSDDTFSADVLVSFENAPATGSLDLSGDGTETVAVGGLNSATSHTFVGVTMSADGGIISLTAAFSDDAACTFIEDNAGTAPAPCSITPACVISSISTSNISACDDNGTADPSDDTFTADIIVAFVNAPASGSLDLSGDGTETVAVGALNSATSHTFVGVTMSADGGSISLTAAFSDDAACTFTEANAGTAPDACSVPDCIIDAISLSNISACDDNGTADPSDDTFSADVLVSFENAPATGSLDLSGDGTETVAVGGLNSATSHTFVGVTMSADGGSISLTAAFSDDAACTFIEDNAGTAPAPCSITPACVISSISTSNISACDDNGTADPSDDTFTADIIVAFVNAPASGSLDLSGDGTETVAVGALNSATSHTFVGVTMSADGGSISLTAAFSDDAACTFTEANAGTAPDACSVPDCIIDAISLSNISACDDNGTADPSDDTFSADVLVSFENAPATGSLDLSGDGTETVAVGGLNSATSHTFVGVTMSADGGSISLTAAFSDDAACTFSEDNAGTAPAPCSNLDCVVENIALGKPAKTPCDYGNSYAGIGNDGITQGSTPWTANPDIVHICQEHEDDWWEVDLGNGNTGETYKIQEICIYNRSSNNTNIVNRLREFYLLISCTPFDMGASADDLLNDPDIYKQYVAGPVGFPSCIQIPEVVGQFVRILMPGPRPIHLAEIEVYGCPYQSNCGPQPDPCAHLPAPSIDPAGPFIDADGPQQLVATPAGGTWMGPGVSSNGMFDPSIGAGTYAISYKLTDGDCEKMDMIQIQVSEAGACIAPYNLAESKPAMQSSTYGNGVAGIAVDGDVDGSRGPWNNPSIQHTRNENRPWWKVDLEAVSQINSIAIFNRTDCCSNRLKDFYLFASKQPIDASRSISALTSDPDIENYYHEGSVGAQKSIPWEVMGRYVAIKLKGNSPLHMAELRVMGCPGGPVDPPLDCSNGGDLENLASYGNATQSSTKGNGVASLAIDGNQEGSSPWANADLQHTDTEAQPWWMVNLGNTGNIDEVKIYNRSNCCQNRLKDFYVFLSDSPLNGNQSTADLSSNAIASYYHEGNAGDIASISFAGTSAQYVMIKLTGNNPLHMSEVEVWGCSEGNSSSSRFADANTDPSAFEKLTLEAYPNPFRGTFTLKASGMQQESAIVEVFNALGQRVEKHLMVKDASLTLGKDLAKGIYFVRLDDGAEIHQLKIVKQK